MTVATIGERVGDTYSGTQDGGMLSAFPTTSYPTLTTNNGPNCLLKFSGLSNITGPVTVSDARIRVKISSGESNTGTYTAYRVLRNWVEGEATWNNWSTAGGAWTAAGCEDTTNDRSGTSSCVLSYSGGYSTAEIFSTSNTVLIADVEAYINGTLSNFGWLIKWGAGSRPAFCLPANATAADRPYLEVTYEVAGGGQPTRTIQQFRSRRA